MKRFTRPMKPTNRALLAIVLGGVLFGCGIGLFFYSRSSHSFPPGLGGLILVMFGRWLFNTGRKARKTEIVGYEPDANGPYVLYLRTFEDDRPASRVPSPTTALAFLTQEEQLVRALEIVGPVVAVGKPGESLPELGARRSYLTEESWHAGVRKLIGSAALVVLRVGATANILWELETAIKVSIPTKIVIIVTNDHARYAQFYSQASTLLPRGLPSPTTVSTRFSRLFADSDRPRGFIYFDAAWQPQFSPTKVHWRLWRGDWHYFPTVYRKSLLPVYAQINVPVTPVQLNWAVLGFVGLTLVIVILGTRLGFF